jgi:hypothetical protein
MEEEYRSADTKAKQQGGGESSPAAPNGVDADKKSISSLEPSPPTPPLNVVTASSTEIGLPPSSAELNDSEGERTVLASKRLCERWLDNLFMVLYEVRIPSPPFPPTKIVFGTIGVDKRRVTNVVSRIYECIPFGERNGNILQSSNYNSISKSMNGSYSAISPCDYTTRSNRSPK